jgi:hypothetical protein
MNRSSVLRRIPLACALTLVAAALGIAAMACEKDNDVIAREQIEQSRGACPDGCIDPPPGCRIKGNISRAGNKVYHRPGGPAYPEIIIEPERGERWFCNENEALRNGWRLTVQEQ